MLKNVFLVAMLSGGLTGCGMANRFASGLSGAPAEICVEGVAYLQFTTGTSVKYTPEGKIATCRK